MKKVFIISILLICFSFLGTGDFLKAFAKEENKIFSSSTATTIEQESKTSKNESFIKWVDFNASYEIIQKVYQLDQKIYSATGKKQFCEILALLTLRNGNNFNIKTDLANLNKISTKLKNGEDVFIAFKDNKYYNHYVQSYHAIFDGIIGSYTSINNEEKYGLKGYFPIAKGYWYNDYDDFGNSRSYGFKRRHLGHDIMGGVGTPIIAVEGGTITELGWNRYGGWRIGIRSYDTKRYYYYAHLRKDHPFVKSLKLGDSVNSGDVIGYLGATGYSTKENVNMKTKPHLHFGMQLIFDKSQEDGNGEIWIDVYQLCRFLNKNRAMVAKDSQTKEHFKI